MDPLEQSSEVTMSEFSEGIGNEEIPVSQPNKGSFPGGKNNPLNGNYSPDEDEEDDDDVEEDLILGDEDAVGGEEEFDVELDEDITVEDIDEDDLVIDPDEEDDEDDL